MWTIYCCLTTALLLPHHPTHHRRPILPPPRAHHPQLATTVETWLEKQQRLEGDSSTPLTAELSSVLLALFGACNLISQKIATASCDSTSCFNELDSDDSDEMLAIDLLAEEVLFDALKRTGAVDVASSESDKVLRHLTLLSPPPLQADAAESDGCDGHHHSEPSAAPAAPPIYSVALDPLDSSSIIDANFAVGTIFGVWATPSLLNVTGRQLVAAGACTYGPRTAISLALADRPGVTEFLLVRDSWRQSNIYSSMGGEGKPSIFAPGNLRATASNDGYAKLVDYFQQSKYTLRYTGGLVPDVTQLLVKGKGIFVSAPEAHERPRLRLLYEAIPMAFLIEKAGGRSSDGERSLLDIEVTESDARTQVALGSAAEVQRFEEMVGPVAV